MTDLEAIFHTLDQLAPDDLEKVRAYIEARRRAANSFHAAPDKVSPNDKAWQEIEQFLSEWDAMGATSVMNDEWLDDLRAESDRRLDDLYKIDGRLP